MKIKAVVMGGGAIGAAIAEFIVSQYDDAQCILTYRHRKPVSVHDRITLCQLDGMDEQKFSELLPTIKETLGQVNWIINTIGLLHDESRDLKPEKRIADFDPVSFRSVIDANVLPTLFAAKHWIPLLDRTSTSVFCAISAKVGSIEDNRLGGWYSYRGSKSCLNMMLKNLSIEFKQKNKSLCVLSLHPGTTDSELSKPFQKNVPPEKLFTPQRTAGQLVNIIAAAQPRATGNFYSWDGTQIPW